jgi:Ca2+/Na+ antiporter
LIYGVLESEDQIAPFQGEAFLDFHLAGVLGGFCFLGWIAFKLQTAFAQSQSFFEIFTWQYFSVWTFFLIFGSLSVVSQIFIYFCWPFYLYFIYRSLYSRPPDSQNAAPTKQVWRVRDV